MGVLAVRPLDPSDLDQYLALRIQSFGLEEATARQWRAVVESDPETGRLGAFAGDELLGALRIMPGAMTIGGRPVPLGGIAGVVVRPEARGHGVARALLDAALAWMRDRDLVVSALHPASLRVYRSAGWEVAGTAGRVSVPTRSLAAIRGGPVPTVRRLGPADDAARREAHARRAGDQPGAVVRSAAFWSWLEADAAATNVYAYGVDLAAGGLAGYVVYAQTRRTDGWGYTIEVQDFVAEDGPTARALWRFLGGHAMQAERTTAPLALETGLQLILDEADTVSVPVNPWMFRSVSIGGAVAARGFAPELTGTAEVAVTDPWLPGAGAWRIEVAAGVGRADPIASAPLTMDVGAFGSLLVGAHDVGTLARTGRLEGSLDAARDLAHLLQTPPPDIVDEF